MMKRQVWLPCARQRLQIRCLCSSSKKWTLPEPTWSVAEMMKEAQKPSSEEPASLKVLAKRSLIHLDESSIDEYTSDLNKMWNWIQQVRRVGDGDLKDTLDSLTEEDIYDKPRGVTKASARPDSGKDNVVDEESVSVYESLLEPKTERVGGHRYFSIPTKEKEV